MFRCKITGGGLAANDEASNFRWADEAEVPRLMDEAYAIRVLDGLRGSAAAAVRPHDSVISASAAAGRCAHCQPKKLDETAARTCSQARNVS